MPTVTVYRAYRLGHVCHFGERSVAKAWAGRNGYVEAIEFPDTLDSDPVDQIERDDSLVAREIECAVAGRMALMLELMLLDPVKHWDECAELLGEYRAAWDEINPMPQLLGLP